MTARTLDHVALWVADRGDVAKRILDVTDAHVIERTDRFTLLGADARRGKLTLFDADGTREPGALKHIAVRVSEGVEGEHDLDGLRLRVLKGDPDLDHAALYSRDPERAARDYVRLGFRTAPPRDDVARVEVGGAYLELHEGTFDETPERPLLNHVGVLVDRADDARELGFEVADVVDAPNTYAVFVWGPERVKIEYVEHKPTFALR